MSKVKVRNVNVLSSESDVFEKFSFEIIFESLEDISEDIEWKLIYVGCAENESHDQVLDSVLVGPIPRGLHKFVLEAPAPNFKLIPKSEIVGLTVILITCNYRNQEFARVGYYINNEYTTEELRDNPPEDPQLSMLRRNIISSDPRITTFQIKWENGVNLYESPSKN